MAATLAAFNSVFQGEIMNGNGRALERNRVSTSAARPSSAQFQEAPHSVEGERGILGCVLAKPVTILEAQERITPQHFYVPAHRAIWDALVAMSELKKAIDIITVTQELRDRNSLEAVGGASYVSELFAFLPMAPSIEFYIDIVRDKFVLREIISACSEAVRRAYEEQGEVRELLDEVQARITAIALDKIVESPLRQIEENVQGVIEDFENAHKHRGRTLGLSTGFVDLDRMTSGLHPSEMIVLAARPSMGKTALAMNIVEHVALERVERGKWKYPGYAVAVFSLETSRHRLVRRMICGRSRVSLQKLRDGMLTTDRSKHEVTDIDKITKTASEFMHAPIYIDETPALRIFDFKSRSRYAVVKLGVKLIVIDYVQLMTTGGKAAASPYERSIELTRISATIKEVARELNVPIIAIAQLNREAEKNSSGKPRMSNLRECGALEQDADLVGLIWREEYYEHDEEAKREIEGEAELIIAKQKDGPVGDIKLTFLKEFTRFENRTAAMYSNDEEQRQH